MNIKIKWKHVNFKYKDIFVFIHLNLHKILGGALSYIVILKDVPTKIAQTNIWENIECRAFKCDKLCNI